MLPGLKTGVCALVLASAAWAVSPPHMSTSERASYRELASSMFSDAFSAYMTHAFPHDELRPLSGTWTDSLIELGNVPHPKRDGYTGVAMTLIDGMDTLAILGNRTAFADAVTWVGAHVSFDQDAVVSVFETTIRLLGGLLSAHLLATGDLPGFAHMRVPGYVGELLRLARDLADRLMPAFESAPPSGLPYAFVHLQQGVVAQPVEEQCTAGMGTNLLELAMLTNLTGDARYARASVRALRSLWARRSAQGLLGNTINIHTGAWLNSFAGIGAGVDSFFEYLAKGALFLSSSELRVMWERAYGAVLQHLKSGPHYLNADMHNPARRRVPSFGSLQAFWPAVQVLVGDVAQADETHDEYMRVWDAYGAMPETYAVRNGAVLAGSVPYPLRPEMAESTLALYRATREHKHLHFGARMLDSLNRVARAPHGFAGLSSVATGEQEDHMASYFLAETLKYLYLLFDEENALHAGMDARAVVLNTEAHPLPVLGEDGLPHEVWQGLADDRREAEAAQFCAALPEALLDSDERYDEAEADAGAVAGMCGGSGGSAPDAAPVATAGAAGAAAAAAAAAAAGVAAGSATTTATGTHQQ